MASRGSSLALGALGALLTTIPVNASALSCIEPEDTVMMVCRRGVCEPGFVVEGELTSTCDVIPRIIDGEARHFEHARALILKHTPRPNGVYGVEADASCFHPSGVTSCQYPRVYWAEHHPTAEGLATVLARRTEWAQKARRRYHRILLTHHALHGSIALVLSIGPFALVLFGTRRHWMHLRIQRTILIFLGITLFQVAGLAFLAYRVVEYTGFGTRELISLMGTLLILLAVPTQFALLVILRGAPPPDRSTADG